MPLALGLALDPRLCLAWPGGSSARAAPARPALHQAGSCPGLFGTPDTRSSNRLRRTRTLGWTRELPEGVIIVTFDHRWTDPEPLSLRGLIVASRSDAGFIVDVAPGLSRRVGCSPGRYLVGVDHSLGKSARVLALLSTGMLLEHRGRLRFMATPGGSPPGWLVAWQMTPAPIPPGARLGRWPDRPRSAHPPGRARARARLRQP